MHYNSIEEYYEAHSKDRWNFGNEWLPKIGSKNKFKKRSGVIRRSIKIHAYVGANGAGKSLAMVHDTLPTLAGIRWKCDNPAHYHMRVQGKTEGWRRVLSTVRLVDPRTGGDHPLYLPYHDHRQLMTIEHADVLMDEITGVASAYEAMSMPTQVNNVLMQLRRRDVVLRWTTPNWAAAAKRIREVTKAVTFCKGSMPIYEEGRTWSSTTKFFWRTYDAGNFEAFTVAVRNRILPETWEHYFRPFKKNVAEDFYDTLSEVLSISSHSSNGLCIHCNGKRNIPRCTCEPDIVDTDENYTKIFTELLEEGRMPKNEEECSDDCEQKQEQESEEDELANLSLPSAVSSSNNTPPLPQFSVFK